LGAGTAREYDNSGSGDSSKPRPRREMLTVLPRRCSFLPRPSWDWGLPSSRRQSARRPPQEQRAVLLRKWVAIGSFAPGCHFCGEVDGAADPRVGAATANVSRHRIVDVRIGGLWILGEQHGGGHQLSGLAVSVLGHLLSEPRALKRMSVALGEPFDGGDPLSLRPGEGRDARANCVPFEID